MRPSNPQERTLDRGSGPSVEKVREILFRFSLTVSDGQVGHILQYLRLLQQWNLSISLTSVTDPEEVLARHFGESMFAVASVPIEHGRLADVGTGAGFPGLAIKIMRPELDLVLVEPNKKKAAFLWEVVRQLDLSRVEVLTSRFEEVSMSSEVNYITARALGGFPSLLRWAKRSLSEEGHVILWVGMEDATRISKVGDWNWSPAIRVPDTQRRFLLIGRQSRPS